jgi:uncharacterized protein
MASTNFDRVLEQVKTLSADEQRQLRALLDMLLAPPGAPPTEDEFERVLVAAGLLSIPKPQDLSVEQYRQYKPVTVQGKPVSETLIKERR